MWLPRCLGLARLLYFLSIMEACYLSAMSPQVQSQLHSTLNGIRLLWHCRAADPASSASRDRTTGAECQQSQENLKFSLPLRDPDAKRAAGKWIGWKYLPPASPCNMAEVHGYRDPSTASRSTLPYNSTTRDDAVCTGRCNQPWRAFCGPLPHGPPGSA